MCSLGVMGVPCPAYKVGPDVYDRLSSTWNKSTAAWNSGEQRNTEVRPGQGVYGGCIVGIGVY